MTLRTLVLTALFACATASALADPCEAPLPRRAGETFSGAVRYVGDGDSLCIGASTCQHLD